MTEPSLTELITGPEIAALYRPTGEAAGLPGRAYGADFYRLEQRHLFPRLWCAVGFAADIPAPGDAVPVELAGWPLILLRDKTAGIKAFHNVCRHRAMRLLPEPCKGKTSLACPWHGWTYDLDGKLAVTPRIGGERANHDPDFKHGDVNLKPVPAGQWHDLIFVNLDGNAPPFAEHIAPLNDLLADYDMSVLRRAEPGWSVTYPANWKIAVESGIEDYHVPYVHPAILKGLQAQTCESRQAGRCYMAVIEHRTFGKDEASSMVQGSGDLLPRIPRRKRGEVERNYFVNIFPTGMISLRQDYMSLGLALPDGPARSRLVAYEYFVRDAAHRPDLRELRHRITMEVAQVFGQDAPLLESVQANSTMRDAAGVGTRFTPEWEASVHHFQKAVIDTLRD